MSQRKTASKKKAPAQPAPAEETHDEPVAPEAEVPAASPEPAEEPPKPTRGPTAKKVKCFHCQWEGQVSDLGHDPCQDKNIYCPNCGRSDGIHDA